MGLYSLGRALSVPRGGRRCAVAERGGRPERLVFGPHGALKMCSGYKRGQQHSGLSAFVEGVLGVPEHSLDGWYRGGGGGNPIEWDSVTCTAAGDTKPSAPDAD